MADINTDFYAEIDAEIYNVSALDSPLSLATVNGLNGQSYQSIVSQPQGSPTGFVAPAELAQVTQNGTTFFYAADGFVGQVFQDPETNQWIVAFRGTDSATDILTSGAYSFAGISTSSVDAGDGATNQMLAAGTFSATTVTTSDGSFDAPGQLADALALTQAVITAAGGSANVTVTGQSLGGGLAGLVSAYLNVRSYIFDAAPFDNQITLQSYIDAKAVLENTPEFAGVPIAINSGDLILGTAPSVAIFSTNTALYQDFYDEADAIYDNFEQALSRNTTSVRIQGEFLSDPNNYAGIGIANGPSTFFDVDAQAIAAGSVSWVSNMGVGAVLVSAGEGDATEQHSPSLIALVLATGSDITPFSVLANSDIAISYAFYGAPTLNGNASPIVAGSVTHPRADSSPQGGLTPVGGGSSFTNTSALRAMGDSAGALERALLENPNLYTSFANQFGTLIDSGMARDGLSQSTFTDNSVHTGLVDLGIQVVRDQMTGPSAADTPTPIALQPFGDIASQNYAIVHLNDITAGAAPGVAPSPMLSTKSEYGTGAVAYGVNELDTVFINDLKAALGNSTALNLSTLDSNLAAWQILVVQAGNQAMNYTPDVNVDFANSNSTAPDMEVSHLIFGGNTTGNSSITASTAMNFIVGGATPTTFNLGQGISGIGDGIGSYVIGGSGQDVADFFNSDVAINETPSDTANSLAASTNSLSARHDVLINIHTIVAPVKAGLLNTINFAYDTSGSLDTVTTNGGANAVVASSVSPLNFVAAGGVNVLGLLSSYSSYQISVNGSEVDFTSNTGVVDHTIGVQDFEFANQLFYTASQLGAHDTSMSLGASSSTEFFGSGSDPITTGGGPVSISYQDTVAGLADSIDVEHFGDTASVGTLTPTLVQAADVIFSDGTAANNAGEINLAYAVNPQALLTAPKGVFDDDYTVTISNGNGSSVTSDITVVVQGLGQTTHITATAAPAPIVENTSIFNGTQTTAGEIDFTDSDVDDKHIAEVTSLGGLYLGNLEATVTQDTTGTGAGGVVSLNYVVDESAIQQIPDGTTVVETYSVTIDDGLGGTASENVNISVTARPNETVVTSTPPSTPSTPLIIDQNATSSGVETVSGTIFFSDADTRDVHSIAQTVQADDAIGGDPGTFSATLVNDTTGSGTGGEIDWTYSVADSALAAMGMSYGHNPYGVIYDITLSDGRGGTETQSESINVSGTTPSAPPTIGLLLLSRITATGAGFNDPNGILTFSDPDSFDTDVVSVKFISASNGDTAPIGTVTQTVYPTDPHDYTEHYVVQNQAAVTGLTDGQSFTETWQIAVDAGYGEVAYKTTTIQFARFNQTIETGVSSVNTGTISANLGTDSSQSATGLLTIYDPNLNVHTLSTPVLLSTTGGTSPVGSLQASLLSDTLASTNDDGQLSWTYSASNTSLDALAEHQVVTEKWGIGVNDGHGGTTTIDITITINGPTDAPPVITGGTTSANVTENASAPATVETAAGAITFNDPDQTDTHAVAVSFVPDPANDAQLGTLTAVLVSDDNGSTDGVINWNYAVNDAALANLAPGTNQTETYAVAISDGHGGTVTQDVTINLHAPVPPLAVTSSAPTLGITELTNATGSSVIDQQSASISFTDGNPADLPTAAMGAITAVYTDATGDTLTLTSAQLSAIENGLSITASPGNTNNGSETVTYAIADNALDFLGQGETVVLTSSVVVDDHHGDTVSTPVTVTINGADDAPVIASADKAITATMTDSATPGSTTLDQQSGAIAFSDPDEHDLPVATLTGQSAVWTDVNGNVQTLTAAQVAEFESAFTIAAAAGNSNSGSENWMYSLADDALNFLAQGEHVVVDNTVTVSDGHGLTDTADIAITLDGTNYAPTIPTNPGVTTGTVAELANTTNSTASDTASGAFAFNDLNLNDHHTVTGSLVSETLSSGTTIPSATLAALTTGLSLTETDSTGSGTGSVNWNFSVADKNFDFLAAGQSLTVDYNVGISDGHGGSVSEPVSVVINGANDAPVVTSAQLTGSVTLAATSATGAIHFTDADLTDTHIVSETLLSTTAQPIVDGSLTTGSIGALGTLSLNLAHDSTAGATGELDWTYHLTGLPLSSPVTETYAVVLADSAGAQVTQDVAINIAQGSAFTNMPITVEADAYGDLGGNAFGFENVFKTGETNTNQNVNSYTFAIEGSDPYYYMQNGDLLKPDVGMTGIPNNHVVAILATNGAGDPSFTFDVTVVQDTNPTDIGNHAASRSWITANSFAVNPSTIHLS